MIKKHKTFFISDLHLEAENPTLTQQFLTFLEGLDKEVDGLYILGDLFEAWIGFDRSEFQQKILAALRATNKKIPVYFLPGNRDFLINERFTERTGVQLLADEEKIYLYETPILLMHGDTLCTADHAYLKMRQILRRAALQKVFLSLPLWLRKKIAMRLRNKSTKYTATTPLIMMDVTQTAVEQVMRHHQVKYLIHGHTHRPAIHEFFIQEGLATRIVLGAWHEKGSALRWDEDGTKTLLTF